MASLQKVKVKGRSYWRIVQSRRVDGKPRAIPILHLGTADALLERLRRAPAEGLRIRSYQHGDVAALKAVADHLGIVSLVDGHARKCARSISVGTTLLLAAMHRLSASHGRRSWTSWAKGVSLPRLFPGVSSEVLTPRFFWDQMDFLPPQTLRRVEDDLTRAIVARLDLRLDTLLYDRSRLFSYLEPVRLTPQRGRRGHSQRAAHERGREDDYRLRFVNHSLLVSRHGRIPIVSQVYDADPDASSGEAPSVLDRVHRRLDNLSLRLRDVTVVFGEDEDAWHDHALSPSRQPGYVAPFRPAGPRPHRDATAVARARLASRGRKNAHVLRLNGEWRDHHDNPSHGGGDHGGPSATGSARPEARRLLSWIHQEARSRLEADGDSHGVLITNRHAWSDHEVMDAWRGRDAVADAFWRAPDDDTGGTALQPDYHWTAHKVQVHALLCWIGFLLERLLEHEARPRLHRQVRAADLLDSLSHVRIALVAWKPAARSRSLLCEWRLEEGDEADLDLFRTLVPQEEPFGPSLRTSGGGKNGANVLPAGTSSTGTNAGGMTGDGKTGSSMSPASKGTTPARASGDAARERGGAPPGESGDAARARDAAGETTEDGTAEGGATEGRGKHRRGPANRATPEREKKTGERRSSRHGAPRRDPAGSPRPRNPRTTGPPRRES